MEKLSERRRAIRLKVEIPTLVEVVGAAEQELPAALRQVYERVQPASEAIGLAQQCVLRELSANGAFLEGQPLPLLSRVKFKFPLAGRGDVQVVGWIMWRRLASVALDRWDGPVELRAGSGVLFETIPLEARTTIAELALAQG